MRVEAVLHRGSGKPSLVRRYLGKDGRRWEGHAYMSEGGLFQTEGPVESKSQEPAWGVWGTAGTLVAEACGTKGESRG